MDNLDRVLEFLHSAGWFAAATVSDGKPRVRPFGSVMKHDGRLYMCAGDYKKVYKELCADPEICVCAVSPSGESWVRITGRAVFDEDAVEAMYNAEPSLRDIYEKRGLRLAAFYIDAGLCELHDASDEYETISF